jgi:hypothetical protein
MSLNIIYNWVVKDKPAELLLSWICLWELNEMPFIKQFLTEEPVLGFRARSIGPGSYDGTSTTNSFLADQSET